MNFKLGRIPVGANDFVTDWYSFDETPGDLELKNFSILRDKNKLIPFIKTVASHSKKTPTFMANPWSPPTWMKFPNAYNYGTLKDDKEIKKAYAQYFVKFINVHNLRKIPVNL